MDTFSQLAGGSLPIRAAHRSFALLFPESLSHPQHTIGVYLIACLLSCPVIAYAAFIASDVSYGGIYAKHPLV
jgi:hypothetical protein